MKQASIRFTVEIAGVPAEICCRYPETKTYMEDFLSEKEPCFTVRPSEEDFETLQKWSEELVAKGYKEYDYAPAMQENILVHSQLSRELLNHDILLVHGSAISMDGEVYLFTAPSGTGKSTHTRLWRESFGDRTMMINDDKPMLKISPAGVEAYGSPWRGKHRLGGNAHGPLKAIIDLTRDTENHIERISAADAFPILKKQAIAFRDVGLMTKILPLEKILVETIPFYRLGCNMEREAAVVAWEGMNQRESSRQGIDID